MTKAANLSALGSNTTTAGDLSSASSLSLQTNSTEQMRITSTGAVSFGSSGTAYGSSGQYLQSNGNATPTWTTVTQTTFSAGTTGFTPNTNTSGTVTLAGTLNIANGGTGETTRQAAIDALAGAVTSGQYLRGNGTDVVMSAIQAADVPTLNQNTTGNAATATNLTSTRTNWSTNGVITAVVGQLAWKNYGNDHTIFDASNSTSPQGTAVNNANAQIAWSGSYPTLMGWNGTNTYGVRVDSARAADNAIGVGQTWQDVTASRVAGTTYTNSTGRSIQIIVTWYNGGANGCIFGMNVNGTEVARQGGWPGGANQFWASISLIIPNGATYSATSYNGSRNRWWELR